jgi:beta-glucosidase
MLPKVKSVTELLSQMSLDEKIAQLGSVWAFELQVDGELDREKMSSRLRHGIGQISRLAGASTYDPVHATRAANRLQKFLIEETRLGIPAILHEECCMGAMVLGGTAFPQMLGLASTFQPELAKAMGTAIRKQLRAIGATQALAPVLDVSRDPRWGRVEETFGEDPLLVSRFGVAYVQGLQGESLKVGVMATGKHFVGYSLSQGGLNCGPVHIGMRELFDVYLAPFQAAIHAAGLASVMNAYPELDGEVVAASRRILTNLLRETLGFDGLVVSDYEAIQMIHEYHRAAADKAAAARMALNAGIDVELPTTVCYGAALKSAVEAGDIPLDLIDLAVSRHLQKKLELGLFDHPFVDEHDTLEVFDTPDNRSLAREIAVRSMVLLKNDGLLPLNKSISSLALIGPNAHNERNLLGDYSYASITELMSMPDRPRSSFTGLHPEELAPHAVRVVSILEGIKAKLSPYARILYAKGCDNLDQDTNGFAEAIQAAKQADVTVLVLGDRSGMAPACTTGETRDSADLRLPGVQEELARAVIAIGKPVVVVLVNGRPYALPWLAEHANAMLEAWLPGEEGGNAVADVLFGDACPGGKLPITFPRSVGQIPIHYSHKPSGMRSQWYVDYVSEKVTPLYSFGHGLSYTTFAYSDLRLSRACATRGESIDVSLSVANSGPRAGDEVVQLYVRDEFATIPRPVKELKGFVRLNLEPGEKRRVVFHLPINLLAFYDEDLKLVLEPGKISVMVGSSSEDIRLSAEFEIIGAEKMPVQERLYDCPVEVLPGDH